ncbi:MAG: hypothetical protein ACFFCI_01570 [Promethearchaeota archaeon]
MKFLNFEKKFSGSHKFALLIILLLSIPLISQFTNRNSGSSNSIIVNDLGVSGQESFTRQWLDNPTLDAPIEPIWYSEKIGDLSDTEALSGLGYANLSVIGDFGVINIDDPLNNVDWIPVNNPEFPISPDSNGSDSSGLFISHEWDEGVDQSRNSPSIHWIRNINFGKNFSDFIITSASLEVIFNASVTAVGSNPLQPHIGGIERPGDYTEGQNPGAGDTQFGIGDFATFYVLISDINNENSFQIAVNRTTDLGQDSPEVNHYPDTAMSTVPEDILISYLTSALEVDNHNFTITLGIDIYCEDNEWNVDIDTWNLLTIRSFNLTFTYEKKINQFSGASWSQDADKISEISNDTVIVEEARLNFKYKIDQDWPTTSSPNSEFRILINDNLYPETVKLSTATSTFQVAKPGGFDVTALITDDVNLSIQLFLADEFALNRTITTSIDDITLNITYTVIFPDKETNLNLFMNSENRTSDPNYAITVGQQLNLTIYYLNQTGGHIPNATVLLSGNFTGVLTEDPILKQYSIIINTDISNIGVNFLTITAKAENYQLYKITPTLTVNKVTTNDLQVFLNNEDMTLDPNIALIIGEELNITVKYEDAMGVHIPNATVRLLTQRITLTLDENSTLEQYSVIVNTSDRINFGGNLLTIEAKTSTFQTKYAYINLYIRKINVEIIAPDTIVKNRGEDIKLQIKLNNTDFGVFMSGATVQYLSDFPQVYEQRTGFLKDLNNGSYSLNISNLPAGTYTLTITAFLGDNYKIEDYKIIILIIYQVPEDSTLFQILFILSIILVTALGAYLIAYYKYLKYPRPIRKVRKYRKTLDRKNAPDVTIIDRETAFGMAYRHEQAVSTKLQKKEPSGVPAPEGEPKVPETKLESEELIKKSVEMKKGLDEIVDKSQ